MNTTEINKKVKELQESPEALKTFVKEHDKFKSEAGKVSGLESDKSTLTTERDNLKSENQSLLEERASVARILNPDASEEELVQMNVQESVQSIVDKNQTQAGVIDELNAELDSAEDEDSEADNVIEIGKKSYEVALPKFRVPGHKDRVFDIDDIKANDIVVTVKVKTKNGYENNEISLQKWAIEKGVIVESKKS